MIENYLIYELSPKERLRFCAAAYILIAACVFLFYRSLLLSLPAGFLARYLIPVYQKYLAGKRSQQLNLQFRDMLYSLSASIAAGRQMDEALIEAYDHLSSAYSDEAPIMRELKYMKKSILENHESDRALLSDFARRSGNEDIAGFTLVYLTCRGMGGDLERIITHTCAVITSKMEISEQIDALISQKKLEGRLICLMPPVMLLALNLLSPAYISVLYDSIAGRLVMTFCLLMTAAGIILMERLSDVEV